MTVSSSTDSVRVSYEDRLAVIELNRPEVLNAMNEDMLRQLLKTMKEVSASEADVVILTGNGRGFSAGGDIKSMLMGTDESAFGPIMDVIGEMMEALYTMPQLVISAIHGPAAGLGFSFALAADYIMSDVNAKLAMNFIGIGLIPDGGGHFFVEKRIGTERAKQLIWNGKAHTAEEALQQGLIDEIAAEDVLAAARKKAQEWLSKPVAAMIETKLILAEANKPKLKQILQLEKAAQEKMRKTQDHKEGISAFLEKRKPNFTGK